MDRRSRNVSLALLTVQICFGLNYLAAKYIVLRISPFVWVNFRLIAASAILGLIGLSQGRKLPRFTQKNHFEMFILSFLGIAINQTCFLLGLKYTTTSNSSILNSISPVLTLLFATLMGHETVTKRKFLAFLCAIFGVLVVVRGENIALNRDHFLGDVLTLVNCCSYALFFVLGKKRLENKDKLWFTFYLFVYGILSTTPMAFPDWLHLDFDWSDRMLWVAVLYAILLGTVVPYVLNTWALAHTEASRVALYICWQPLIATVTAYWLFSEPITPRTIVGGAFVFGGVALASRQV